MRINNINPKTSQLTFNPEPITSALFKNESGKYKFTIPPLTNSILTLDLITTNQHYNCNLPVHSYERNMKYECNIRQSKGIQNAEDLIAFSHLINGLNYTGNKCLDDFMEIKGMTPYISYQQTLNYQIMIVTNFSQLELLLITNSSIYLTERTTPYLI